MIIWVHLFWSSHLLPLSRKRRCSFELPVTISMPATNFFIRRQLFLHVMPSTSLATAQKCDQCAFVKRNKDQSSRNHSSVLYIDKSNRPVYQKAYKAIAFKIFLRLVTSSGKWCEYVCGTNTYLSSSNVSFVLFVVKEKKQKLFFEKRCAKTEEHLSPASREISPLSIQVRVAFDCCFFPCFFSSAIQTQAQLSKKGFWSPFCTPTTVTSQTLLLSNRWAVNWTDQ